VKLGLAADRQELCRLHEHGMVDPFGCTVPDDATVVPAEACGVNAHAHRAVGMQTGHDWFASAVVDNSS
jgi:hypothetical protein